MSANIKVSGRVYNGIENISVKDTSDAQVSFLLRGATPEPFVIYKPNDVTFYDYDGTVFVSYTKSEFLALSVLPANPTHVGLVADGWNWTLSDAKDYVAAYGALNIGQMYHTESGKTEYDIEINDANGFTATLTGTSGTEKDWGDGNTDTLETHTYATAGSYTIKLSGTTLPSVSNSRKLIEVRIADGVETLSSGIFDSCYYLKAATIPSSVTSIEGKVFRVCIALQFVVIPNGVMEIPSYLFAGDRMLLSCAIPNGITNIGDSAFSNCASLLNITIPSTTLTIGTHSFSGSGLQSIVLPNGIEEIGGYSSFYQCTALKSAVFPASITSIGDTTFASGRLVVLTVLAPTPPTLGTGLVQVILPPASLQKIYIPNGTLSSYQSATNWSEFSALFVELPA